jgi:hypothetical protein
LHVYNEGRELKTCGVLVVAISHVLATQAKATHFRGEDDGRWPRARKKSSCIMHHVFPVPGPALNRMGCASLCPWARPLEIVCRRGYKLWTARMYGDVEH